MKSYIKVCDYSFSPFLLWPSSLLRAKGGFLFLEGTWLSVACWSAVGGGVPRVIGTTLGAVIGGGFALVGMLGGGM